MVMSRAWFYAIALVGVLLVPVPAGAEDAYRRVTLEQPADLVLEAGGLACIPDGRLAVATRRGEVWIAENPYAADGRGVKWRLFANALHEPLGLAFHDGALFTGQRSEITRLRDTDGDGIADEYRCVAKGWGVTGAYHEYTYGPKFDPKGDMWVTLNCTMGDVVVPDRDWRGYGLCITPDGKWKPVSGGMRSPCGIGINADGDVFYTDQQGHWNSACGVHHIRQGAFHGHTASFASAKLPDAPFKEPTELVENVPVAEAARRMPIYKPAAVWLPYRKMGMSATDLVLDNTGGKFGPFTGQFFVGELTQAWVNRVFLEKVGGEYQGACFPFMDGFQSGVLRLEFGEDGSLFVGETSRGWSSVGIKPYGVERVLWNGRPPFSMRTMEARPKGFRCTFTKPVSPDRVKQAVWKMRSYTYEYHAEYGGPDIDVKEPGVRISSVSDDGLTVELEVGELREGYIHELQVTGLRSKDDDQLAPDIAHYTLNKIPTAP
jgi:glucose/arabinose dehydrogenase